jgi:hypothetical protein
MGKNTKNGKKDIKKFFHLGQNKNGYPPADGEQFHLEMNRVTACFGL